MTIQGIDRVARRSLLLHRLATLEQPGWVPRFSKAHHISPNLTKSHQISPKLTKDDQIWPRCSGSPRRAGGWTSWSQGWSGCSTLPGCRFASPSSNPILFFCFPIQFGLVKPAPVQFSWVQVLKQRGEEEETCTAEVWPFNFFTILIHYHFLNLYCSPSLWPGGTFQLPTTCAGQVQTDSHCSQRHDAVVPCWFDRLSVWGVIVCLRRECWVENAGRTKLLPLGQVR